MLLFLEGPGAEVGVRGEEGAFEEFVVIQGQDVIGEAVGEFLFSLLAVRVHHFQVMFHEEESPFRRVVAASYFVEDRAAQESVGLHARPEPVFREAFLPDCVPVRFEIALKEGCAVLFEHEGADPDIRLVFERPGIEIGLDADGLVDEEREQDDNHDDERQDGCPNDDPPPSLFRFLVCCHRLFTWKRL